MDVTAPSTGVSKGEIPEQQPEVPDNAENVEALKSVAAQQGGGGKNPWAGLAVGTSARKPHTTVRSSSLYCKQTHRCPPDGPQPIPPPT